MKTTLPTKTVERLSQYRRVLITCQRENKKHVYSYEIAQLLHISPEQVRRDLMLIGYSSTLKKGYDIDELIKQIEEILDPVEVMDVVIIGMGNLGTAITKYFSRKRKHLNIVAAFDIDPDKTDRVLAGIKCLHISKLEETIKDRNISIAILTMPMELANEIAQRTVLAGIKGILNYTTFPILVPGHVYLEEYDMITSLEKVAYFVKNKN